jgi:hypothetical protein
MTPRGHPAGSSPRPPSQWHRRRIRPVERAAWPSPGWLQVPSSTSLRAIHPGLLLSRETARYRARRGATLRARRAGLRREDGILVPPRCRGAALPDGPRFSREARGFGGHRRGARGWKPLTLALSPLTRGEGTGADVPLRLTSLSLLSLSSGSLAPRSGERARVRGQRSSPTACRAARRGSRSSRDPARRRGRLPRRGRGSAPRRRRPRAWRSPRRARGARARPCGAR